jgi:hypothetical protein
MQNIDSTISIQGHITDKVLHQMEMNISREWEKEYLQPIICNYLPYYQPSLHLQQLSSFCSRTYYHHFCLKI